MSVVSVDRQEFVLDLRDFQDIEPLKELFWSELSYDRVNQPLSRRGWTENAAWVLADDPLLLATGADDFHVLYSRLRSNKLLMSDECPVVSKLLHHHLYALFFVSNSTQKELHFLNVKYDDDVQKRRLLRRIRVGPNERLRTTKAQTGARSEALD